MKDFNDREINIPITIPENESLKYKTEEKLNDVYQEHVQRKRLKKEKLF